MDIQTQRIPPVPSALPDSVAAPPSTSNHAAGVKARRRASPPPPLTTQDARPRKRSPNYVHTQAASPAVISSLIDQLSAISIPAHDHFENLLVGYSNGLPPSGTTSIRTVSATGSTGGHDGSSLDNANSLRDQNDLYPDDACEPPVIRTSKPPSGYSALTAPKKKDKPHSLSSYIGRNSGSSASLHSVHSNQSAVSFGNISIEAGVPRQPAAGSARSSVESKRSVKGHRSLMYMSSRERLKLKESERKRHNTEDTATNDSPRKVLAAPAFSYEDTIKEEPTSREENRPFQGDSSKFVPRFPDSGSAPRRLRLNLVDSPERGSPSESGLIPDRGSSLRHTGSPTRKSRKNRTPAAKRPEPPQADITPENSKKMDDESVMKEKVLQELEQEENEVAQRIRELREQKLRRDKLAGKQPVGIDAGATPPSVPHVSVDPAPEHSPTSTVSSASEKRVQGSTKAHKVLGINVPALGIVKALDIQPEAPTVQKTQPELEGLAVPQTQEWSRSKRRSLTLNDGDDITPLPIDYTLALKNLAATPTSPTFPIIPHPYSPPSSSISIASSKETRSGPPTLRRSSSAAVGGRSAIGRRASNSGMDSPRGHRQSLSVSDGIINMKPEISRSASEEGRPRHKSMIAPLPASNSNSLQVQRRRTFNKKRWSHPDLPAKAEKKHNEKVDRAEAAASGAPAVQKVPFPVIEERPASLDEIDVEVESYLNSTRLSQKIRHPQTGRVISFSEVGDPNGFAVFVCVGMGLTRFVMAFYDQLAATLKLRLITPDRPGVGGSQVDPNGTPLSWPDDVLVICQALKITKFSMLAHSAGAVYALATSLRMPQHIRGRVHLLAPWIPPSQMAPIGISQDSPPTQQLPRSQRILRALPPSLLKVANATFLSATSASLQRTGPKNSPKTRRKSLAPQPIAPPRPSLKETRRESMMHMDQIVPNASSLTLPITNASDSQEEKLKEEMTLAETERQRAFDERVTFAIWDRATAHANPATDLIVCLETKQTIGFRYEDINRPVVIHHGSKDSRVPVDNVRWLGKLMRKCEVRILEGEQHGLMASAQVMGNVLTEMANDWEDWTAVVQGKGDHRSLSRKRTAERLRTTMSRDDLRTRML